jgi:adenosine deaminase CECR1
MYATGLDQGLIYHETRKNMGSAGCGLYVMDCSGASASTNGKKYLADPLCDLHLGQEAPANFSANNPYFVGHKRISSSQRQGALNGAFKQQITNAAKRVPLFPDELLGFDMVGQEDAGYSTIYYLERLLDPTVTGLPFYMHGGETSWADELIPSDLVDDPVGTLQNTMDILLLQTHRVGHGLGYIKHPYRLEVIQQRQVPFEVRSKFRFVTLSL